MKKIININFHGRVVPIEETAYDILKQYVESLRKHFANEEGRDEIINDIENRFAELFSERLQKGSTCITDQDVNAIIASMGRPEDFDGEDMSQPAGAGPAQGQSTYQGQTGYEQEPKRLYRSENDKLLGGVCAGLANYLRIDPSIMRIIFVLTTFAGFGAGIFIYLVLWVVLPKGSTSYASRKRLYRNPDNRVLGGVASGLAAYFHTEVWIPRLIFALPLISGIIPAVFRHSRFDFDPGPVIFFGGFGGTLFITYIILWILLPEAKTASEKLEMRGEKVDLESIKNTIKSDLEGFREKAGVVGGEIKERAQQFGTNVKQASRQFTTEVSPAAQRTGNGIAHVIGVLFKAFFLFIAGIIAFVLITVLIGLLFSGAGVLPFRHYVLSGMWQNFWAWCAVVFFLIVPVVGLLTWLIRRIFGVRSRNNYLGYVFGTLWTFGWVSLIVFISMMTANFRSRTSVQDELPMSNPAISKLLIRVADSNVDYYGSDWFGFNWDDDDHHMPFFGLTQDSVMMRTVRLSFAKSADSDFHIQRVRFSRGNNPVVARALANDIQFDVQQRDSVLILPQGFALTPKQKFRNQQVLIIVEVPVGKKIVRAHNTDDYRWFDIEVNRRNFRWTDDYWDNNGTDAGVEYIMTESGLKRTNRANKEIEDDGNNDNTEQANPGYRYHPQTDSIKPKKKTAPAIHKDSSGKKEEGRTATNPLPAESSKQDYSLYPVISSLLM